MTATHTTEATATNDGYVVEYDDGYGTTIAVERTDTVGRFVLEVTSLGDTVRVQLPLATANVLDSVIRRVTKLTRDDDAPITGSR